MCLPSSSTPAPPPTPRWLQDTSKEIIVSKYELSDKNKERNKKRTQAKLGKRRVLMETNDDGPDDKPDGNNGTTIMTTDAFGSNDASGGYLA